MRNRRQKLMASFLLYIFISPMFYANDTVDYKPIPANQADSLGILLTQTFEGRIQPTHTLAYDVIHKISKKSSITTSNGVELTLYRFLQILWWINSIGLIKNNLHAIVRVWRFFRYFRKYASVADFFNEDGSEKLALQLQNFAKKDVDKNVFDKELIKANEQMNIALQSMNGLIMNIFPISGDENNKWVNWKDEYAKQRQTQRISICQPSHFQEYSDLISWN